MDGSVDVVIPVDADVAGALDEPGKRAMIGHVLSGLIRSPSTERLFEAIAELKADAHARGLTDEIVDAELEAYNAEGRDEGHSGG